MRFEDIDNLESIIGRKLLIRGAQGVKLTEYGQCFINEGHSLIRHSEEVLERTRFSGPDEVKPIRIGYIPLAPIEEFNKICLSSPKLGTFNTSVIQYSANLSSDNPLFEQPGIPASRLPWYV